VEFAEALTLAGQAEDALHAYLELFELCELHDFRDLFCQAVLGYQALRQDLATLDGPHHLRVAKALEFAGNDGALHARLLAARVAASFFISPVEQRVAWMREALELSERAADPKARLAVLECADNAYVYVASAGGMLELADEMLDLAGRSRSMHRLVEASRWRAASLLELGRGQEFRTETLRVREQAHRLGLPHISYWLDVFDGTRAFLQGSLDEAETLARAALPKGEPMFGASAHGTFAAQLVPIALEKQGDARRAALAEILTETRNVLAVAPGYVPMIVVVAFIEMEQGHENAARNLLRMAHEPGFTPLGPGDRHFLCVLSTLSDMVCYLGDRQAAASLRDTLARFAGRHVLLSHGAGYFGPVDTRLGNLSLVLSDFSVAATHYECAVAESEKSLSVTAKAWAEFGLSRALREVAGDENLGRSAELLESARTAAKKYGMGRLSELCT
jgi:hypothetical protein